MQSIVLKITEIDLKNRLTVEHYICQYIQMINKLSQSVYPLIPLGKVAEVKGGKRLPVNAQYSIIGIPYVRVIDIGDFEVNLSDAVYISHDLYNKIQLYQLRQNDIALVIVGATIGKAAIFKSSISPCNFNENLARITCKDKTLNPEYLLAYLQSCFGQAYMNWLTGGSAQAKLSLERIEKIEIPIPPRCIQDNIAQVMQDAHIKKQQFLQERDVLLNSFDDFLMREIGLSSIDLRDEKNFTVTIKKMIGGRFDRDLYNTKYTNLVLSLKERFNSSLKTLAYICEPITSGATPLNSQYLKTGVPFLRVQNLSIDGIINLEKCLFVSHEFAKSINRSNIQDGDILLVIVGATIGKCAVVRDINSVTVINQALARIRVKKNLPINPDYLQAFLSCQAGQIQISALKRPVAQGNLSLTETGQILIPIIPDEVQNTIAKEMEHRRFLIKKLRTEADQIILQAKARVERMILGQEEVT